MGLLTQAGQSRERCREPHCDCLWKELAKPSQFVNKCFLFWCKTSLALSIFNVTVRSMRMSRRDDRDGIANSYIIASIFAFV